jgi:hypothetical protein
MKKLIMTFVILFSFIGCDWTIETIPRGGRIDDYDWELPQEIIDYMEEVDQLTEKDLPIRVGCPQTDLELYKIRKIVWFLNDFIEYTPDREVWNYKNVWQLPETTWKLKTGDCEDKAILAMYVLYKFTGTKGNILRLKRKGGGHAILSFIHNEKELFIDADTVYNDFSILSQTYEIKEYISYEETICDTMEKEYKLL